MKHFKRQLVGFGIICLVMILLSGCIGTSQSEIEVSQDDYEALVKVSETDKYWLECELAWTETSIADLEGTTDMTAARNFERALEEVGSEALLDAYDQYVQEFNTYVFSDTPEYMWEQEWQVVLDSLLIFLKIYATELRDYLESR